MSFCQTAHVAPGEAPPTALIKLAEELAARLAERGWAVWSGGRDCGVMAAVSRGAAAVPGHCVVGILPDENAAAATQLDLLNSTGMGQARNVINVLASDGVVMRGAGGPGTASEAPPRHQVRQAALLAANPCTMDTILFRAWMNRFRCLLRWICY